jgi:hypothetical protein
VRTYVYRSVTLTSYTGGGNGNKPASSHFGPVKAGLTITHGQGTTKAESLARLTELLNYLEREATILESKSLKVLSISKEGTTHLVEPKLSTIDITGTEVID